MDAATTPSLALAQLLRSPWKMLVERWNWKAALFSSLFRGGIFFTVNLAAGWRAAVGALAAEFILRAATSGFYGAVTQSFRGVEPAWKGAVAVLMILPVFQHSAEFLVHWSRGTPKLVTSIAASAAFTGISTLFNLHVMRQGALIVGEGSRPLWEDIARLPRIIGGFVMTGLRRAWAP